MWKLVRISLAILIAAAWAWPPRAGAATPYKRSVHAYEVPDVTLVDQDGREVRLLELIGEGRPVLVDFIYATCTTICPVLSAGFANFQKKMGEDCPTLISITIDPEHDTPEEMTAYLRRYGAKPGWFFLTGSRPDIDRVMKAFQAYVPNKMSHLPVTFLRVPATGEWVRIDGLVSTSVLLKEYRKVMGR
ncbi:MAG: SCO family protein [Candidatus Dadabacteria bacterium]|nr:MAG: SCO family protein [Candidatus Dadabacteria bacterium]